MSMFTSMKISDFRHGLRQLATSPRLSVVIPLRHSQPRQAKTSLPPSNIPHTPHSLPLHSFSHIQHARYLHARPQTPSFRNPRTRIRLGRRSATNIIITTNRCARSMSCMWEGKSHSCCCALSTSLFLSCLRYENGHWRTL